MQLSPSELRSLLMCNKEWHAHEVKSFLVTQSFDV